MKKQFFAILWLCIASSVSWCQISDTLQGEASSVSGDNLAVFSELEDIGIQFKYEQSFGIVAHSNGFGANFRRGKHITGYRKRILALEMVTMKHPKEYKVYNPARENAKGYIYGKLNSALILRPTIGLQGVITSKADKGGVEVRYLVQGGGSLCVLKPVYLEILQEVGNTGDYKLVTEKYNAQKHSTYNIYGKAPFLKGVGESTLVPGAFGKFGLSFEYGEPAAKIRSIETGISLDFYYKTVPIMADLNSDDNFDPNNMIFLAFYVSINYGKKW